MLTAALTLSAASTQTSALSDWAKKHFPKVVECAKNLMQPPFTISELEQLATQSVVAALIESAFLKLFPEKAPSAAPVVDAPEVAPGGVQ